MIEVTWNSWTRRHAMFWSLGSSRLKSGYSAPRKTRQICRWTIFTSGTVCYTLSIYVWSFEISFTLFTWVWKQPEVRSGQSSSSAFYSVYVWFLFTLTRFFNILAIFFSCLLYCSGRKKFILSAPLKEVDRGSLVDIWVKLWTPSFFLMYSFLDRKTIQR